MNQKTWIAKLLIFSLFVFAINSCKKDEKDSKENPLLNWSNPDDIHYETPLSTIQLNASANVQGTFVYTPGIGTILNEGADQELKVDFKPTDSVAYNSISKTVRINVLAPVGVTDIDGNFYHIVTIGNQVWMIENLKTTRFRNGDSIPRVPDAVQWSNQTTAAYCEYNNDYANAGIYGNLYNWHAMNDARTISPEGWHVPTGLEYLALAEFVEYKARRLMEIGSVHWFNNVVADNSSGYTALPGGYRDGEGVYKNLGFYASFWSADPNSFKWAINSPELMTSNIDVPKTYGISIRCIKDK